MRRAPFKAPFRVFTVCALAALRPSSAVAQAAAAPAQQQLSVIDPDPIASVRAQSMGGAIAPIADDMDAAFNNPAGIGGLKHDSVKDAPVIRKLYFPWLSAGENANSSKLMSEMQSKGGLGNSAVGQAVVDANADQREYGRINAALGTVIGRLMVVPFEDVQVASTARGQGTNILDTNYRSESGAGAGFSVQDATGRFSLGYFGYVADRSSVNAPLTYSDFIDTESRNAAFKANEIDTSGFGQNAGIDWRMGNKGSPTLGVVVKNAGGAKFHGSAGTEIDKQEVDVGFAVEPQIAKWGTLNLVFQADKLDDQTTTLVKKYHLGSELLVGGYGSYATLAVRAGYNYAGPSGGLFLNLGLIAVEAGVYSVDIAADNSRVVDRRGEVTVYINVANF